MSRQLRAFALIILLSLVLAACGGADTDTDTEAADVVALAADADGATIYTARCASCHGADLGGTNKGPSQLSIVYEPNHHGDDAYRSAVRNGAPQHHWPFGDMLAVPDITDEQVEAVIVYIRAEQQRLGFEQ